MHAKLSSGLDDKTFGPSHCLLSTVCVCMSSEGSCETATSLLAYIQNVQKFDELSHLSIGLANTYHNKGAFCYILTISKGPEDCP